MQHRAYICEARILHTVDGPMSKGGKVCHFPFIIKIGNVTKKYTSCSHEKVQYNPTLGLKPNFHSFPELMGQIMASCKSRIESGANFDSSCGIVEFGCGILEYGISGVEFSI